MTNPKYGTANQGEGNRDAALEYNKHATEFAESGKVEKKAKAAEEAIEGPEAADPKKAEKEGLAKARH
ncbi:MAG: hypothetical protein AB7F96_05800 [Beijerinckiaceae bacterium]